MNFLIWLKERLARFFGKVFYINGPDTLPPPLSPQEEAEYVSRLGGDRTARDALIVHNLRLVVYIARKYETSGAGIEDLISIGSIGLIKAVETFKPDRGIKLATYASRCIENEILMYLRKISGLRAEVSIDEPLNADADGNELLLSDVLGSDGSEIGRGVESEAERTVLAELVSRLGAREREITELRFGLCGRRELTQKEVADKLGISQSYISRLEKRILSRLKSELESLV
ncbi:MAG: sigma-70 family RNA polymerase sigma factor [Clostridia bacterium]|nr:sigma-70 family RNA polymerase sigma factor [Clostridia bacterium]